MIDKGIMVGIIAGGVNMCYALGMQKLEPFLALSDRMYGEPKGNVDQIVVRKVWWGKAVKSQINSCYDLDL